MGNCLDVLVATTAHHGPTSPYSSPLDSRPVSSALSGRESLQDELFATQMQLALMESLSDSQDANAASGPVAASGSRLTVEEVGLLSTSVFGDVCEKGGDGKNTSGEEKTEAQGKAREGSGAAIDARAGEDGDLDCECSICWGEFTAGEEIMVSLSGERGGLMSSVNPPGRLKLGRKHFPEVRKSLIGEPLCNTGSV